MLWGLIVLAVLIILFYKFKNSTPAQSFYSRSNRNTTYDLGDKEGFGCARPGCSMDYLTISPGRTHDIIPYSCGDVWRYGCVDRCNDPHQGLSLDDIVDRRCPIHSSYVDTCNFCEDLVPDNSPETRRFNCDTDWTRSKEQDENGEMKALYVPDHEPLYT